MTAQLDFGLRPAPLPPLYRGEPVVARRGREVRRFTPAEDAVIRRLKLEGVGDVEIGRRLGRRQNSIAGRVMTLARHEEAGHGDR